MYFKNRKRTNLLVLIMLLFLVPNVSAKQNDVISEVLLIKAENDTVLVKVAKKYPKVNFSQEPNKLKVEFVDTKYHKQFELGNEFVESVKKNLIFVENVSVSEIKKTDSESVLIELDLKPGIKVLPKVASTVNNLITIAFKAEDVTSSKEVLIENKNQEINNKLTEKYNNATAEYDKGNIDVAEQAYKEMIEEYPGFSAAKYNLAKIFSDKGRSDDAVILLKSIINEYSVSPENLLDNKLLFLVHNLLGIIYSKKELIPDSNAEFAKAIEVNSQISDVYFNLALNHELEKDLTAALADLQKAVELNPAYSEAYYHLGVLNFALGNKQDAINAFNKVLEIGSNQNLLDLSKKELKKLDKKGFKLFK